MIVPATAMGTTIAVLRCTSSRFTVFYFLPFFGALALAGDGTVAWAAFAAGYWFLHSLGTEAANRLADREEDAINRPERTALCAAVGWDRLRRIAIGAWLGVVLLDVVLVALRPSVLLAVLLVLAGLSAIGYSYGPKLSRSAWAAPILLTFHFGGTFISGWAVSHPAWNAASGRDFLDHALPLYAVSSVTLLALGGTKDVTDIAGDESIGYHSPWVALVRRHGAWLTWALIGSTFVLTAALVATAVLEPRFLAMFVLVPVAVALRRCLWRATTPAEQHATRELFYQYWMLYLAVSVTLYAPRPATYAAVAGALAFWVLATRLLHWSPGLDRAFFATVSGLLVRGSAATPARDRPREGIA